jgi:hypothetical protein
MVLVGVSVMMMMPEPVLMRGELLRQVVLVMLVMPEGWR